MTQRILLAYTGDIATAAGIAWLRDTYSADVVTLTLDVGQGTDLEEARARALAAGAVRAHVLDARDQFARDHVLPLLQAAAALPAGSANGSADQRVPDGEVASLAAPLIASKLMEIATIEGAAAVAHSLSAPDVLELAVAAVAPHLAVIALPPVADGAAHERPVAPNLLVRPAVDAARALDVPAMIDITFEGGTPVAVNGVRFELSDLIECVSLIAGRHAIGGARPLSAPGAAVLSAAYEVMPPSASGIVRFKLFKGELAVLAVDDLAQPLAAPSAELLVNHA